MNNVAIIGTGALGSALIGCFNAGGIIVKYYDNDTIKPRTADSLEEVVREAEVIFLCIPTRSIKETAEQVVNFNKKAVIVSLSKGMTDDGKTASEILSEVLNGKNQWAVIGGPMIAKEIESGEHSVTAVIGAKDGSVTEIVRKIFEQSGMNTVSNKDPFAVSLLGILKNAYAFGMGILTGLDVSQNEKASYFKMALLEMEMFCRIKKINVEIVDSPAGKGDLIKTCSSAESRNRTMGLELAKAGKISTFGESFYAAPQFFNRFQNMTIKMPILNFLIDVIRGVRQAKDIVSIIT